MSDIKLGDRVRDRISGFEGIATGHTEWLWGCDRYIVSPVALKDGAPIASQWFDAPQLEVVAKAAINTADRGGETLGSARPGGPQADPSPSSRDPKR